MKNIIIIDIDALMPSRLSSNGKLEYIAPTINKLSKSSLNCTNSFSMGNPTEFALPGMFASSYLLDHGGYKYGISSNPKTFAEVIKNNGYHTCNFLNSFRPKNNGYDRGFDETYKIWDFQVIVKNLMNVANWYRSQFRKKNSVISDNKCVNEMINYYHEYLDEAISYCEYSKYYKQEGIYLNSSIFNNINFDELKKKIIADKKIFLGKENIYIKKFFEDESKKLGLEIISEEIVRKRFNKIKNTILDIKIRFILLRNIFLMWRKSSNFFSGKTLVGNVLNRILKGRKNDLTRYQTGGYNLKILLNWLKKKNKKMPFFVYMKLHDAHEQNIYTHDIQNENLVQDEIINISNFFKNISKDKSYLGNALYDCGINYCDGIIKKILNFLEAEKILDNTILVILSDHGGRFPNIPIRDKNSHRVNDFFDELYKIPLIIYNKDLNAQNYDGLVSSVDINSTLLHLVGIKNPSSFRGKSILDKDFERNYVLFENQGRGPCDLENKPIRICVRSKFQKIIYEFKKYENNSGKVIRAYDLANDPDEYYDLSQNILFIKKSESLVNIAKKRVEDIFQQRKL